MLLLHLLALLLATVVIVVVNVSVVCTIAVAVAVIVTVMYPLWTHAMTRCTLFGFEHETNAFFALLVSCT